MKTIEVKVMTAEPSDETGQATNSNTESPIPEANRPYEHLPSYKSAWEFCRTFEPVGSAENWEWVCEYAKARHGRLWADFKELDDKAASLITHLGGGAGLVAIFSFAKDTVHPLVLFAIVPAMVCALLALREAVASRQSLELPSTTVRMATLYATQFSHEPAKAEAYFLGRMHYESQLIVDIIAMKAKLYDSAASWCRSAVAWLALPVAVALCVSSWNWYQARGGSQQPPKPVVSQLVK